MDRRAIFLDDGDRLDLLRRLERVLPECGSHLFAWCFLSNHFHAVLQSGDVPVGAVLRRVLTGYALGFNRSRDRFGYVFQGRFGSRRIVDDMDLRVAIRYVHRNPIDAGIVKDLDSLERFPWSGHSALMGAREPLAFEAVEAVLAAFESKPHRARGALREWMEAPPEDAAPREQASERLGRGSLAALIEAVCRHLDVEPHLLSPRHRHREASDARAVLAYLAVDELKIATKDVARGLGVTPAAVSQARRKGRGKAAQLGLGPESLTNLLKC